MSNTIDQDTGASQFGTFSTDDFHEFPADVVGMATLRDTVFVFTKAGIWTISNVALPIVDAYGNGSIVCSALGRCRVAVAGRCCAVARFAAGVRGRRRLHDGCRRSA
jgi:hypothetical protein